MKGTKLTAIARTLMFCSLWTVLCSPLLGEDIKPSETNMNAEIKQNEEKAQILARIRENTRKYPKIGVNLCYVRWADVGKCIKQIKEDKLGDIVVLFAVGLGSRETKKPTVQEQTQYYTNWGTLLKQNGLFYFGINDPLLIRIAPEYYVGDWGLNETGNYRPYPTFDGEFANMKEAREGLIKAQQITAKSKHFPSLGVIGGPLGHGEGLEAGTDIMFSEHYQIIGFSLASARGSSKAYQRPLWGAWLNMEYCAGGDGYGPAHQRRLMLDYNMSHIYGADLIVLQDCLFEIGILHATAPNMPTYDMNSPQCRGFREKAKAFYKYVQSHPRSGQAPAVNIGLVWGNLEGAPPQSELLNVTPRTEIWWQSRENWKATIEQGWNNLINADLFSLSCPVRNNSFRYTGTPYGQVDIVPIRAPIDVLQKYKTLMFLGWNTMTPEIYGKLKDYVKNGGTLFMSLPQLSQQIERKPELELINNGDLRDLFGVTIKGKLERKGDEKIKNVVRFDRESQLEQCKFPVGTKFEYTEEKSVFALMKEKALLSGKTENETDKTFLFDIDWSAGVKASYIMKGTCLTGEPTNNFIGRPAAGEFIRWQSTVVPENSRGNKATFIMASGLGSNRGNGLHELFMNGRKILEINTSYGATIHWQSEIATGKFETTFIDINDDIFGLFSVTVNPEIIEYGKSQKFEMKGKASSGEGWFAISEVKNPGSLNVKELRAKMTKPASGPKLEWADIKLEGARVLASVNDGQTPMLIENKLGKGMAYLMTPCSFSPAPAEFIEPLVVGTVKAGEIELLGEMDEKKDINYAVYPGKTTEEETKILLVNIDWTTANNVKNVKMRIKDMIMPVEVKEGAIKTINVLSDLALTVGDDQNQCLSLEKFVDGKYTGKVTGQGACVIKGTMRGDKGPQKATLDGKDILFKYDPATHALTAECNLWGEHILEITR